MSPAVLRLYNTLTRSVEPLRPVAPPAVTIYVCGPTVYDDPHIGHARSAYIFDLLRRYLESQTYQVRFVRNVTDVDDKIIEKAKQEVGAGGVGRGAGDLKTTCREVAERYLTSYHATMDRLGIRRPDVEPRATERVVPEMTDFISKLLLQGAAYEAQGDVYFAVRKFPGYGTLSHRALDDLQAGARVEPGEHKHDPLDFALWKATKPDEPSWNSPWGPGRPGWHIECSAMSTKELGDEFDIHGGGVDLVFPHHENEIAQAQAAGKPFARTWVHNGLLTVNGEKMSKSLGNFITVEQSLQECHGDSNILKIFFLGAHYRSPIDYSKESIKAAAGRWNRWYYFLVPAEAQRSSVSMVDNIPQELSALRAEFQRAMDDDLNTPEALAVLDRVISCGYRWWKELLASQQPDEQGFRTARAKVVTVADVFRDLSQVLGLSWRSLPPLTGGDQALYIRYQQARERTDFKVSDAIRKELEERGFVLQDMPPGSPLGGSILLPKP